jgi:hypothetical protein
MTRWEYGRFEWLEQLADNNVAAAMQKKSPDVRIEPTISGQSWIMNGEFHAAGSTRGAVHFSDIGSAMMYIGQQGWELVSHTRLQEGALPGSLLYREVFQFKRPIQE